MNKIDNIMALAKEYRDAIIEDGIKRQALRAAIEQALAVQPEKRPQNCGTGFCSCIECPYPDHFPDAGKMIEPFGFFRSTMYGWEDCAETDDGAKPLYEAPRPQHEQDNDLLTIAYMAGFDAGKEAAPQPLREPNWYCLNAIREATLCANEQDAQQTAKDCEMFFPNQAPFRAAQLVEADRKRNEAVAEFAGKGVKGRQDIQPGATQ